MGLTERYMYDINTFFMKLTLPQNKNQISFCKILLKIKCTLQKLSEIGFDAMVIP